MTSIGIIGECMIELSRADVSGADASEHNELLYQKRYGGDTYNTAYYLAQCAKSKIDVNYVTALGDDAISDDMIATFSAAGVKTDLIEKIPGAVPGLYAIQTDEHGERSFLYWRSEAPARQLFQTPQSEALKSKLLKKDWLYFSGITLAILHAKGRETFFEFCQAFRVQGGKIAFDINYRPRLWASEDEAKSIIDRAYAICDLALPSYDDETLLFKTSSPQNAIDRITKLGAKEIVLKNGAEEVYVHSHGQTEKHAIVPATDVKDTTSAGDSFNAGYLYARLSDHDISTAVKAGSNLAKQVIAQTGAIVPVTPPTF
ncbi:sugar kinase [uncultured Kiloniella sp.]|uniref:sugar kinase n=1 Tax=uncultured Kiloniella sp. TaxID=1133091 RepID=UPI002616E782|nr:sugar kinase [uncultured Kiloniella sp.]